MTVALCAGEKVGASAFLERVQSHRWSARFNGRNEEEQRFEIEAEVWRHTREALLPH